MFRIKLKCFHFCSLDGWLSQWSGVCLRLGCEPKLSHVFLGLPVQVVFNLTSGQTIALSLTEIRISKKKKKNIILHVLQREQKLSIQRFSSGVSSEVYWNATFRLQEAHSNSSNGGFRTEEYLLTPALRISLVSSIRCELCSINSFFVVLTGESMYTVGEVTSAIGTLRISRKWLVRIGTMYIFNVCHVIWFGTRSE